MPEPGRPGELRLLRSTLRDIGPMVVAFSGGADSAFLAWVATDTLGSDHVHCVTAVSPSLAPDELDDCRRLAAEWGLSFAEVETDELSDPSYSANDGSRCFHCKSALMEALTPLAQLDPAPWARTGRGALSGSGPDRRKAESAGPSTPAATVVLGVNVDDLGDHRPGQQAAAEAGARFPLVEAGFSKAQVRTWSRRLGLRTWDKPAAACLSSRIPYGTPVTVHALAMVARAESSLRGLGFTQLRVRHYDDTARIEVPIRDLVTLVERRQEVVTALHEAGYRYVTVDLDGFRSGNLNDALRGPMAAGPVPVPLGGRR